jgi:hypothetical protein
VRPATFSNILNRQSSTDCKPTPDIKTLLSTGIICVLYLPACQGKGANEGVVWATSVDGPACRGLAGQGRGLNTLDFNRIHYIGIKSFL